MRSFENDKPENHRVIIKIFFYKLNRSKNLNDRIKIFDFYLRKN